MIAIPSAVPFIICVPAMVIAVGSNNVAAILIASAALVTAIGTSWVNIMAAREVKEKVKENTDITLEVKEKTAVIEGHVNSADSRSKGMIESLEVQNTMLRDMITKLETTAALSAQAAVGRSTPTDLVTPELLEVPAVTARLEGIEAHTEATAKNTATTDIKVAEALKQKQETPNK